MMKVKLYSSSVDELNSTQNVEMRIFSLIAPTDLGGVDVFPGIGDF
jgi:hypothetical protein